MFIVFTRCEFVDETPAVPGQLQGMLPANA
jgi:hypothetical protein